VRTAPPSTRRRRTVALDAGHSWMDVGHEAGTCLTTGQHHSIARTAASRDAFCPSGGMVAPATQIRNRAGVQTNIATAARTSGTKRTHTTFRSPHRTTTQPRTTCHNATDRQEATSLPPPHGVGARACSLPQACRTSSSVTSIHAAGPHPTCLLPIKTGMHRLLTHTLCWASPPPPPSSHTGACATTLQASCIGCASCHKAPPSDLLSRQGQYQVQQMWGNDKH